MFNKKILGLLLISMVAGCGSGGSSDEKATASSSNSNSSSQSTPDCTIIMSTISLSEGESCNLTTEDSALFSISPGKVTCKDGKINYGNGISGAKITLNGLVFACTNS